MNASVSNNYSSLGHDVNSNNKMRASTIMMHTKPTNPSSGDLSEIQKSVKNYGNMRRGSAVDVSNFDQLL